MQTTFKNVVTATLIALAGPVCVLPAWAQGAAVMDLNIPAQPLDATLRQLAEKHKIQFVFNPAVVRGVQAPELRGSYTIEQAMQRLTEGTRLAYTFNGRDAVTVRERDGPTPAGDKSSGASTVLERLVVTAQKRTENLMEVPVAITALDAESITQRGLVSAEDYLRTIPSVAYVDQGPGQQIVVIRGAYGEPFATGPTVGIYFGDIPLTGLAIGATADIKLVDMERVEVLRGPQGTLYGSNSLSGTVRYIPAAPKTDRSEARVDVGISDTARYGGVNGDAQAMLNVPLVKDRLAVRAVAYHFAKTGFIKNVAGDDPRMQASAIFFGATGQAGNQNHVGTTTIDGARVALLWKPLTDLSIGFTYVRQNDAADDRPFSQRGFGEYERSVYRFGPIVGEEDSLKTTLDIKNLTVDWRVPWGSFYSSTAVIRLDYRRLWQIGNFFPVSGNTPPVPQDSITNARLVTEEARFTSDFRGPLQLVAGFYYEDSEQPSVQPAFYTGDPARNPFGTNQAGLLYVTDPLDRQYKQTAGFGEVSYAITPRFKLTGGARVFRYDATFKSVLSFSSNPRIIPMTSFIGEADESGQIYKAALEFKPNARTLVYGKYSQGFRLGRPKNIAQIQAFCDVNPRDGLIDGSDLSASDPLIKSDRLDSYEIGAKATIGSAALTAAAYHNKWKDIPVAFRPPTCTLVSAPFNVGEVKVDGIELEGVAYVTPALRVDFGAGFVHSRLATTSPLGREAALMQAAPKQNGHIGAEYRFDLRGHEAFVRGDYSYYGEWWSGLGKTGTKFDAYGVLGFSAGMSFDRVEVRAFVDNATGKYAVTSESGWPANGIYPIRPRTIGVRLGYRF